MADTRVVPEIPRRDDAFLVDDVRVCPLAGNEPVGCWWVTDGHPHGASVGCVCLPPLELYRHGRAPA
jgi:hypothetical protein